MRDLIRHMLTPNPEFRPDIFELQDLLETWSDHESIEINPDAQKIKEEAMRKEGKKIIKQKKQENKLYQGRKNTDLTAEELQQIQRKLAQQKLEEQKKFHVPLHQDYDAKMKTELYAKNEKPKSKPKQKEDDLAWADFESSNKPKKTPAKNTSSNEEWFDFDKPSGTSSKETAKKSKQDGKLAQKQADFEFDFNTPNTIDSKKPKGKDLCFKNLAKANNSPGQADFFGMSENKY